MSKNPYLSRRAKPQRHGDKAERLTSRRLGARQTPASGAGDSKGDMTVSSFRIENKSTIKDSLSIKLEWLLKIAQEALETGSTPALSFQFVNAEGVPRRKGKWVVIPESVFEELVSEVSEERG